jgi:plasmid replication initiation protein
MVNPLLPIRHPTRDFFACDIFDALPYFKDDQVSMEHPVFSLSTKPDMRTLHYEHNGNSITIKPSYDGLATIHDKDILLYCASYLRAAIQEGREPNQRLQFTAYDLLISTNRSTDGDSYERLKDAFNRLRGTTIITNIKTGGLQIEKGFGVIDSWGIVKETPNGRVIAIEVKLSDWTYNAILANELLTINREYFRLRRPLDRRIYELARKHCGDQPSWKIRLETLQKKIGSNAPLKKFRLNVRQIVETNHLPDYSITLGDDDIVTFTNRRRSIPAARQTSLPLLRTETYEKAKRAAPGWDIYRLEAEWREWSAGHEPPHHPDAAFIAFCRKKDRKGGNNG